LSGNRLAFTSWQHVRPGVPRWVGADDVFIDIGGSADRHGVTFRPVEVPTGVRLVVELGTKDPESMIRPSVPHERNVIVISVVQDGDNYLGWGKCDTADGQSHSMMVTSTDGVHWDRPSFGLIESFGSRDNNYVTPMSDLFAGRAICGATVFLDPTSPPEERFKAVGPHYFPREQVLTYLQHRPDAADQKALTKIPAEGSKSLGQEPGAAYGLEGLTSADGIHWTHIPEPLTIVHADSQAVCGYDQVAGRYVGFVRGWVTSWFEPYSGQAWMGSQHDYDNNWLHSGRRVVARTETTDFRRWPLAEPVLCDTPAMRPSESIYAAAWSTFPGAPELQLLFPTVWDTASDSHTAYLASTPDGQGHTWQWLPDSKIAEPGEPGSPDGGTVFVHPNLLELPNGDFGLPCSGFAAPHKYPRSNISFGTNFIRWPKGRLVGVRAESDGEFQTVAILPRGGRRISINAVSSRSGQIRVELLRFDGSVVEGCDLDSCVPLVGDCYGRVVSWGDGGFPHLPPGEPFRLRFELRRATVYWVEFTD
jgi:hypothetical protein